MSSPISPKKTKESLTWIAPLSPAFDFEKSKQQRDIENLSKELLTPTAPLSPAFDFEKSEQQRDIENLSTRITQQERPPKQTKVPLSRYHKVFDEQNAALLARPPIIKPNHRAYNDYRRFEIEVNPHSNPVFETPLQQAAPPMRNSSSTDSGVDEEVSPLGSYTDEDAFAINYRADEELSPVNLNTEENYSNYDDSPTDYQSNGIFGEEYCDHYQINLGDRTNRFNAFKKYLFNFIDQNPSIELAIKNDLKKFIEKDCSESIEEQTNVLSVILGNICTHDRDANGNNIIHLIIESGFIEALNILNDRRPVDLWILINQKNKNGDTPLHIAAEQKFAEGMSILAYYRASTDVKNSLTGDTPLHIATKKKFAEGMEILLDYEASVDLPNQLTGDTALLMAVRSCFTEGIKILLEYNANPQQPNTKTNMTPWMLIQYESTTEEVIELFGV